MSKLVSCLPVRLATANSAPPTRTVLRKDITRATIQIVEGLTADQLVQAVAHEFGHALGIAGHSDDRRDLMYPFAHYPAVVTDRDVNTLKIAYQNLDGVEACGGLVASR